MYDNIIKKLYFVRKIIFYHYFSRNGEIYKKKRTIIRTSYDKNKKQVKVNVKK